MRDIDLKYFEFLKKLFSNNVYREKCFALDILPNYSGNYKLKSSMSQRIFIYNLFYLYLKDSQYQYRIDDQSRNDIDKFFQNEFNNLNMILFMQYILYDQNIQSLCYALNKVGIKINVMEYVKIIDCYMLKAFHFIVSEDL